MRNVGCLRVQNKCQSRLLSSSLLLCAFDFQEAADSQLPAPWCRQHIGLQPESGRNEKSSGHNRLPSSLMVGMFNTKIRFQYPVQVFTREKTPRGGKMSRKNRFLRCCVRSIHCCCWRLCLNRWSFPHLKLLDSTGNQKASLEVNATVSFFFFCMVSSKLLAARNECSWSSSLQGMGTLLLEANHSNVRQWKVWQPCVSRHAYWQPG